MADRGRDTDERSSRQAGRECAGPERLYDGSEVEPAEADPVRVLAGKSIALTSNAPARASAMLGAQRSHGNRAVQRMMQVQRDDDDLPRRPRFNLLPPSLQMPLGPMNGTLTPGGAELSYEHGPLHAGAEYSWGGPLDLSLGYGAPLQPWLMDAGPSLSAGGAALTNPLAPGNLGAIGGMAGTLGDIAGSGGSPYQWGVGLQGSIGPEEQRIMAGLTINY